MFRYQILIDHLTLEEKAKLVTGADVWHTRAIKRLNIPSIMMSDGPHGLRKQIDHEDNLGINRSEPATLFPPASLSACSFDPKLLFEMGRRIGQEASVQNVQLVLGPGTNIKRSPLCGRNFEYFSEDPLLSGKLASGWIEGIQSEKIGACVKHFTCNNQETNRFLTNAIVDERTLHEIYLKPFEIAIKSKPKALMTSYNQLNNQYVNETPELLKDLVRSKWKYQGCLITDWGATHDRIKSLKAGQDLEMPSSGTYQAKKILNAIKNKELSEQDLNQAISNILDLVMGFSPSEKKSCNYEEHHQFARRVAQESIVLLKNDEKILPLSPNEKVLFTGELFENPRLQGGGSSYIEPTKVDLLINHYQSYSSEAHYLQGYTHQDTNKDTKLNRRFREEVIKQAGNYQKIIVFLGLPEVLETEGVDRKSLSLPNSQIRFITELAKVHQNIIVVLLSGSPVVIPELPEIKGVIYGGLLGQAGSLALLDILYGVINPSGRLAETYPKELPPIEFPGDNLSTWYKEGIYVGYRYYDTFHVPVLYPFGHGLSYSTFTYQKLKVSKPVLTENGSLKVSCTVQNTSLITGKEVVQLYLHHENPSIDRPIKELIAFEKIELKPGETKEVTFDITKADLSFYSRELHEFYSEAGRYQLMIGKSVNDIVLETSFIYLNEGENTPTLPSLYFTSDEIFKTALTFTPWKRKLKKVRPFTLNSTFRMLRKSMIGKIMFLVLKRQAKQMIKNTDKAWMKRVFIETILDTPLRTAATMSSGALTLKQAEGIVDLANGKLLTGWKKFKEK